MSIRLVVADDSLLVREGIVRVLGLEPDLDVVALCGDYPELMSAVDREAPDVVITDIRMPPTGTDEGIRAAAQLREHAPRGRGGGAVASTSSRRTRWPCSTPGSEGRAYLLKERVSDPAELIDAVAGGGAPAAR